MSSFATAFAGRHVTVLSGSPSGVEHTDTGTLVDMDGNWIQLAKDNGEMLLFHTPRSASSSCSTSSRPSLQ